MATGKSDHGEVAQALCDYYQARSGYTGLIITKHAYIMKKRKGKPESACHRCGN